EALRPGVRAPAQHDLARLLLGVRPSKHDSRGSRTEVVDNAGMAKTFRPYEPDQLRLMPPSLADWVPEDHLARFVSEVVDTLDLEAIEVTYPEERGYPPNHPPMMVIDERGRNGRPAPLHPQL